MDTHVDTHTYTKRLRVNLYVYHILFPFASRYINKVRGEKFGIYVKQLLAHKPLVILIARLSLFLVMYIGIPVTESQSVWPDENGYRYTEWALVYISSS